MCSNYCDANFKYFEGKDKIMEKELTELTIEELKELAEKESIEIKEEEKEKIIEKIKKARELKAKSPVESGQKPTESRQETEKTSNEKENKGKGKGKEKTEDSIDKEQKKVEVPEGFTKKTNLNKKEYGYYKGRKYKKLKNGYGMWADTGTAFVIKDLK